MLLRLRLATGLTALGMMALPPASASAQEAPSYDSISAELKAMFEADQVERRSGQLSPENDRRRIVRVKALLDVDSIDTGADYYHAALIMQHSSDRTGRDHLLAHVLSSVAALLGH